MTDNSVAQVLEWRDIMQGAIRVARHGFRGRLTQSPGIITYNGFADGTSCLVSEDMVVKMNATIKNGKTYLLDDPIFAAEFAPKGRSRLIAVSPRLTNYIAGELLKLGEVMTRKNLAKYVAILHPRRHHL